MKPLTKLDSLFVHKESSNHPMHLGMVLIIDSTENTQPFELSSVEDYLQYKIQSHRLFRQRLIEAPLDMSGPFWVDDPDFQLSQHLKAINLQTKNTERELVDIASNWFETALPRNKPLWEIILIKNGSDKGSVSANYHAVAIKAHLSYMHNLPEWEIISSLINLNPTKPKPLPDTPWNPPPLPSSIRLIRENLFESPVKLVDTTAEVLKHRLYKILIQQIKKGLRLTGHSSSAPVTSFNQDTSEARAIQFFELPVLKLKELKSNAPGATLNDIIITICSEALLRQCEQAPSHPIIALTPISVRSKQLNTPTGTQLSSALISLHTIESNLAKRLKLISQHTKLSEAYGEAIPASNLTSSHPATILGIATRIYSELQLTPQLTKEFNLPLVNIPGTDKPMYFSESRIVNLHPYVPLMDGLGAAVIVMSYSEKVTFNLIACPDVALQQEKWSEACEEAYLKLATDLKTTDFKKEIIDLELSTSKKNAFNQLIDELTTLIKNLVTAKEEQSKDFDKTKREKESI